MKISGQMGLFGILGSFHVRQPQLAAVSQPHRSIVPDNRYEFIRIQSKVVKLSKALEEIDPLRFKPRSLAAVASAANATSTSDLGDLATETAAVMTSTEEVNTTSTSFSTFGPDWISSTAQATMSGTYDGSNGTATLTFKVDREGTHGENDVKIKVYDPNNQEIDQIDIDKEHPIDQEYTLSNGLIFTLGQGSLLKNDTFTLGVVDSVPTSFSPALPGWKGSTALSTLDGVYDGSNGTGTLTFEVDKEGTHGESDVKVKVYDPNNQEIDQIDIDKEHPIDQEYTLSNGLIFTLGEGDLLEHTTFTLNVYDAVGSAVNPNKPMNGTRNNNPNLEYGLSVTDGSFQVNGVTIDIYASDTINTVLDRITQSDAGVSATFDATTETVVLTQKTPGSMPTIVLENDTSGFLAAMKLESATPTAGTDGDPEKPLAEVERFSSVQSGTTSVNGVAIAIDVNVDSLNDVLDRINASGAGVTASLNDTARRVTIVSNDLSQELVLDSGQTGFFSALEISDGTYHPTQASGGRKGMSQSYAYQVADAIQDVAEALNALYEEPESGAAPNPFLLQLRQGIQSAISKSFDSEGSRFRTKFGVNFDFRDTTRPIFDFSESDRSRLLSVLTNKRQVREVGNLFFGTFSLKTDGLLERLKAALEQAESDLEMTLGSAGLLLDAWA